ncbi:MAG: hypothetical protein JO033_06005 [Acidobacteriaceae bacterium]|nr:hypothetical protein [Acidobacteriaceae bacterium]
MQRVSHDPLVDEKADALCKLLRQFRPDEDVEPGPGFYSRVLDEIAAKQASMWFPLAYMRLTFRLTLICVFVISSALLVMLGSEGTHAQNEHSVTADLMSNQPESQRNAVLAFFLADSSVDSPDSVAR